MPQLKPDFHPQHLDTVHKIDSLKLPVRKNGFIFQTLSSLKTYYNEFKSPYRCNRRRNFLLFIGMAHLWNTDWRFDG